MEANAERERIAAEPAEAGTDPAPPSADYEKLRLRFEQELYDAQGAGAALDPLLKRPARP